jgi:hypothetical protein
VIAHAPQCRHRLSYPVIVPYPERFAQQALGHNSKAMHHAYSKRAEITVPSLDDWEKQWRRREDGGQKAEDGQNGIPKPAVVQVDFKAQQGSVAADAGEMAVAAVAQRGLRDG